MFLIFYFCLAFFFFGGLLAQDTCTERKCFYRGSCDERTQDCVCDFGFCGDFCSVSPHVLELNRAQRGTLQDADPNRKTVGWCDRSQEFYSVAEFEEFDKAYIIEEAGQLRVLGAVGYVPSMQKFDLISLSPKVTEDGNSVHELTVSSMMYQKKLAGSSDSNWYITVMQRRTGVNVVFTVTVVPNRAVSFIPGVPSWAAYLLVILGPLSVAACLFAFVRTWRKRRRNNDSSATQTSSKGGTGRKKRRRTMSNANATQSPAVAGQQSVNEMSAMGMQGASAYSMTNNGGGAYYAEGAAGAYGAGTVAAAPTGGLQMDSSSYQQQSYW